MASMRQRLRRNRQVLHLGHLRRRALRFESLEDRKMLALFAVNSTSDTRDANARDIEDEFGHLFATGDGMLNESRELDEPF